MVSLLDLIFGVIFIAIIIVAIICADNLYDRAKLISLISEIEKNKSDIDMFVKKYNYMPGDFPFAENFFSSAKAGNGDNLVDDNYESLDAWLHMFEAKITYAEFNNFNLTYAKIYANMKNSSNILCGYQIIADSKLNNIYYDLGNKKNYLRLAVDKGFGNLTKSCLTSEQVYFLDKKLDDGLPVKGKLLADDGYNIKGCICKNNDKYYYCALNNDKTCILQYLINK